MEPGFTPTWTGAPNVRAGNRARVLQLLSRLGPSSRTELAERAALKPPTMTRIVHELIEVGIVEEVAERKAHAGPGRRQTEVRILPDGGFVLGLALTASGILVAISGLDGRIIEIRTVKNARRLSAETVLARLATEALELVSRHVPETARLLGATVACAGEVDVQTGHLQESVALGWRDVAVGPILAGKLNTPVFVQNLNLVLLEARYSGEQASPGDDTMLVRVANGLIGCAIHHQMQTIDSPTTRTSWFGHYPIRDGNLQCFCGETGCLHTAASGPAMLSAWEGRSLNPGKTQIGVLASEAKIRSLIRSADKGDVDASRALSDGGAALGRFLVPFAVQFGLKKVFIAGFVGRSPIYFDAAAATFRKCLPAGLSVSCELVVDRTATVEAAGHVALQHYAFSPLLDISRFDPSRRYSDSRTKRRPAATYA